jgi:hypothetical protein
MTRTTPLRRHRRTLAGAVAALAVGGLLAGCGSSSTGTTSASNAAATTPGTASSTQGMPPGMGMAVAGAAADKAKAAALAKYKGTVERVMKLPDGSYVVHVLRTSGGEVHVEVSKAFQVTGTEQGPPTGAAPPSSTGSTT